MRIKVPLCCEAALAVFLLVLVPAASSAQEREPARVAFTGLLGTGLIDSELGLTAGAGAAVSSARYAVRVVLDVHLIQPDDSGYRWDLGGAGPECREERSGQPVDESFCSIARTLTGVSAEASYIIPAFSGGLHVGAGFRAGSGSTLYGTAGYGFNPTAARWNLLFRVAAGRDLLGVQAVATVPLTQR